MRTRILTMLMAITLMATLSACQDRNALTDTSNDSEDTSAAGNLLQPEETLGRFHTDAILSETVMVDENGVKITATGLTYTDYSVDLELTIENNSGKNLSFLSGALGYSCNSVNGYMVNDGYLNCNVANGKKTKESISFSYDTLMLYGINEIADVEIGFSMTDEKYDTIYSGPRQLKTSAVETYNYATDAYQATITSQAAMDTYGYEVLRFTQDVLYDQNGVTLRSSSVISNGSGGTVLLLEMENTTEDMVNISTSDITLNGLQLYSSIWSSNTINPGKRGIIMVDFSSILEPAYWEEYGITDVNSVGLSLGQYSEDGIERAPETPVEVVITDGGVRFDTAGTEVYNQNGLRIATKGVFGDASDSSGDLYVLMLAENNSGKTISVNDVYGSLSVNGFMTDYSYYSQELEDGESAVLKIKLWESSLEENQITSTLDIREIEIAFEIKEGNTTIDEPMLTFVFEK